MHKGFGHIFTKGDGVFPDDYIWIFQQITCAVIILIKVKADSLIWAIYYKRENTLNNWDLDHNPPSSHQSWQMDFDGNRLIPIYSEWKPINSRWHGHKRDSLSLLCQRRQLRILRLPLWFTFRETWHMNGRWTFTPFSSRSYWQYTLTLILEDWDSVKNGSSGCSWHSSWTCLRSFLSMDQVC